MAAVLKQWTVVWNTIEREEEYEVTLLNHNVPEEDKMIHILNKIQLSQVWSIERDIDRKILICPLELGLCKWLD